MIILIEEKHIDLYEKWHYFCLKGWRQTFLDSPKYDAIKSGFIKKFNGNFSVFAEKALRADAFKA